MIPAERPDVAVADEDAVGLQLHLRIGFEKMPRALPMRGGAAAVEQAGFGEDIGAGADAGDADAALCAIARTKPSVFSQVAACRTPSPPATIRVVIAPDGFSPRAIISTPEEERTGPGVTATTLIDGGVLGEARRDLEHRNRAGGVEQLEIRKHENADHLQLAFG